MSKTVETENASIQWIDHPYEIDRSFFDEVPLIPEKLVQSNTDFLMDNAVDKLFECNNPEPWAVFIPFKEYKSSVKRLFKKKVLETFDLSLAYDTLDDFPEDEESADKLYALLEELGRLNEMLEEIYLKILSCLKP